ncbi:protein kinase [Streptomyces sp. NBC_01381]|uniref:serine/threonine-protein kinase n=1 Tax=Streptomyces sp. NBC_01381 TaxID=2903845 RepID=UPI00224D2FA9|nr:serine/threonine-protein kinase [Streptomyces sp. NBC_01381]MCX4665542.1 protein kinase [Streptomyces sp. NBC_01381]
MEKLGPGDPQRIGVYRLLARLGAGGMGHVYLARSDRGRTVAVKLVREELAEQEEFRNRFRQEVQAARRVGGAWTAPVLDADTEAAIPWLATGYVAGPSLQSVISQDHGPLPERSVKILAAGLANALKDIHAAGLIHRDLKPSNVLVTIDGPRVIDFGIARALETVTDGGLTRTGALVGSPGFMAPEQVRGDRVTPACDVFCLGSVLAYAASGALPFGTANSGVHALMFRIAQEEPDLSALPEELAELVADCLRKTPADRPTLEQILERTGAEDTLGDGGRTRDPWLPGALVAQLGRHAVQLLDTENPDESSPVSLAPPKELTKGAAAAEAPAAPAATPDNPPADDTPPPPGKPGEAPLDHLPTMISGTPPPTPPPGPSYGYPQQHPQPQHPQPQIPPAAPYGYPQQAGYGPTPPYGPVVTPMAEPPRRSGRSTAALIAVALIVAIGAGGGVYAVMKGEGDAKAGGDSSKSPTSSAPSEQGTPSEDESSEPESPPTSAADEKNEDGEVPEKILGTWSGAIENDLGHNSRELVFQQGEIGDTVLSITADGPTDTGGTYHCVFQGKLESASGNTLRIGPTDVVVGQPASSCKAGTASTVTLLSDGRLHRENTGTDKGLTYEKDG